MMQCLPSILSQSHTFITVNSLHRPLPSSSQLSVRKSYQLLLMTNEGSAAVQGKRRTFKKFTFRGVDLDALLTMKPVELLPLMTSRVRRKFNRGLTRKPMALIKKLNKAKKEAPEHEQPEVVKTHLRNVRVIPCLNTYCS